MLHFISISINKQAVGTYFHHFCFKHLHLQKNGRAYKIGDRLIEIHNDILNNIVEWNTPLHRNDPDIDYAFGLSLLLIPAVHIAAGRTDNNALTFVLGMLLISDIFYS